jgi:hypothetical protein
MTDACGAGQVHGSVGRRLTEEKKMMMNYKTLVAASLMSIALTSAASAQCADCATYPDRDILNNGAQTPAAKMGLMRPGGAAGSPSTANTANSANGANNPRNARAEVRPSHPRRSSHGSGVDANRVK